jgi:hypothetical protein
MDPNSPWVAVLIIGGIIGLIVVRRLMVRLLSALLATMGGRTLCGVLLFVGGLIYGQTSQMTATGEYDNRWPVGGGLAAAGVLLLVINVLVARAERHK